VNVSLAQCPQGRPGRPEERPETSGYRLQRPHLTLPYDENIHPASASSAKLRWSLATFAASFGPNSPDVWLVAPPSDTTRLDGDARSSHEARRSCVGQEHQIGLSRQIRHVQSEAVAERMRKTPKPSSGLVSFARIAAMFRRR